MKTTVSRILVMLMVMFAAMTAYAADNADAILKKTVSKISSAPSLVFKFTASGTDGRSVSGTLTMEKQKFCYDTDPMKVWYDGKSQWTLSSSTKEVNLTSPTDDELVESNPFTLITGYSGRFNAKTLTKTATSCTIMLTPKVKGGTVKSAEITINTKTNMPEAMKIVMNGNQTISVAIVSATTGKTLPASTFSYQASRYPGYTLVDLR